MVISHSGVFIKQTMALFGFGNSSNLPLSVTKCDSPYPLHKNDDADIDNECHDNDNGDCDGDITVKLADIRY